MKTLKQPKKGDYSNFFTSYLKKVSGEEYEKYLLNQIELLKELFNSKNDLWAETTYAENKWTPKEVLGHILDTERIMAFRALCIARGEKSSLPGFDQDPYVLNARFGHVSVELLLKDFEIQRMSLLSMLNILPPDSLDLEGFANGNSITPRALLWIIPGHFEHHYNIFTEKY